MQDDTVSSTAFNVAQGILFTSTRKNVSALVSEQEKIFYRNIMDASNAGREKLKQIESPMFRLMIPMIEKLMIPGLTIHYILRKKAIEGFVRSAIKEGAKQIVNLGAGFDSLAYRLTEEDSSLRILEIDHPATHKVKKEALVNMGKVPENLFMLDVDFNKDSLVEKLQNFKNFDPNLKTVFIIEGVLMYLDQPKIVALLDSLKSVTHKGFRLVFTFIRPDGEGKYTHGPLLGLYLKIKKEPLNWKISQENLKEFLNENGIPLQSVVKSEEILNKLMPGTTGVVVHDGELIACADTPGNKK